MLYYGSSLVPNTDLKLVYDRPFIDSKDFKKKLGLYHEWGLRGNMVSAAAVVSSYCKQEGGVKQKTKLLFFYDEEPKTKLLKSSTTNLIKSNTSSCDK